MHDLSIMNVIPLRDALLDMDNGKPFHIKFVSFNKTLRKGGEFIEVQRASKCTQKYNLKNNDMIAINNINNSAHPYPVHIHLITEYNHQRVMI